MADVNTSNNMNKPRLRDALDQVRPEMATLTEGELQQVHVDPFTAAGTVRGSLARIMQYRSQLETEVPKFDLSKLDKLGLYALALVQAQTAHSIAFTPPEMIASLAEEAAKIRDALLSDATALAKRGQLNPAPLAELKGTTGFRNIAGDVLSLALLLRTNWTAIAAKTCVTLDELDRAEVIGDQLLDAVGAREQNPKTLAEVSLERQQAYTLFMNAYDQVRRAVHFLRWNDDDADEIAPSLYAGRTATRKKAVSDVEKKTDPATAPTPATAAGTSPTAAATAATAKPAIGLPGADPFVH